MSCITKMLFLAIAMMCLHESYAHTYLSALYLNDQKLSEGDCIRPHPPSNKEYPLLDVAGSDMTCGWLPYAAQRANRKCPIAAGSKIGVQWQHNYNSATDDILEATHKGSIIFYLAKSESGSGNVWFKIFEDGLKDGRWGVDRLLDNRGRIDLEDIASGNYLLRGEVLALHNAYDVGGIQPYVGCVELTISGSGSATPQGVSFPGAYTPTGPGMVINIYQQVNSYTIPGPALYRAGTVTPTSTLSPTTRPTSTPSSQPTKAPTPTSTPTSAATTRPTSTPTTRPTSTPTSGTRNTIQIMLQLGSNEWWAGVQMNGGGGTIAKVEWKDNKADAQWVALQDMSYAYVYGKNLKQDLPITIRVTSSTNKQVIFDDIITSWVPTLIDTGITF